MDFNPLHRPHLDHASALISYSTQGQFADRVLIHLDTELGEKHLLNDRMATCQSRVALRMPKFLPITEKSSHKPSRRVLSDEM
jgi:hypothetical protein